MMKEKGFMSSCAEQTNTTVSSEKRLTCKLMLSEINNSSRTISGDIVFFFTEPLRFRNGEICWMMQKMAIYKTDWEKYQINFCVKTYLEKKEKDCRWKVIWFISYLSTHKIQTKMFLPFSEFHL